MEEAKKIMNGNILKSCNILTNHKLHKVFYFFFKKANPGPHFVYFRSFQATLQKNCSVQRDSNSDYHSGMRAYKPLDHGSANKKLIIIVNSK